MSSIEEGRSNLAAVLTNLTDGVLMTDSEERIILANPAAERLLILRRQTPLVIP